MASKYVKVWVKSQQHDTSEYSEYELVSAGPPLVLKHKESGFFASRILELGLTGYGHTADESRDKVEEMFRSMVRVVRTIGESNNLEKWLERLTRLGVTWQWSEGPEDELVYP